MRKDSRIVLWYWGILLSVAAVAAFLRHWGHEIGSVIYPILLVGFYWLGKAIAVLLVGIFLWWLVTELIADGIRKSH